MGFFQRRFLSGCLFCAAVFSAAFLAGSGVMMANNDKNVSASLAGSDVLAAEKMEDSEGSSFEGASLEGKKLSSSMLGAKNSVKEKASRIAKARRAARQEAAFQAFLRSVPEPTGPTTMGVGGRRVCGKKNDKPQKGGTVHVDEDCCPDYDETPNPRCYYTPEQRAILR